MEKLLTQLERALIILDSLVILEAFGLVALAYKVSQKQTSKPDQMIHLTVTNGAEFQIALGRESNDYSGKRDESRAVMV